MHSVKNLGTASRNCLIAKLSLPRTRSGTGPDAMPLLPPVPVKWKPRELGQRLDGLGLT
jgi:hypothetical protein